jgi:HK97 gp10 family phage protein
MGRWRGREKLERRLKALTSPRAERMLGDALFEAAQIIGIEAQALIMRGSASGQVGGKHQHIRSQPGDPPMNEFGTLHGGIETVQVAPLVVQVSSTAAHSKPLEFGTSKMAARPYMRPARDAKRREARDRFAAQVERIVKGAAD